MQSIRFLLTLIIINFFTFAQPAHKPQPSNNIIIFFHLYNLDLMDEFISKINHFVTINNTKNFYIKIAIPVDDNIEAFKISDDVIANIQDRQNIYADCLKSAPYHSEKITPENYLTLFLISQYLKENLVIDSSKTQIIFTENRGVDVGSFLLLMDQLIKQNIRHDFIVKIHTKTDQRWREKLLTILDIEFDKLPENIECVYACNRTLSPTHSVPRERACSERVFPFVKRVLKHFKLKTPNQISSCAGTMFIVSHRITDFFKQHNRLKLYKKFNLKFPKYKSFLLEHGLEITFGHLFEHLNMKRLILSDFWADNFI